MHLYQRSQYRSTINDFLKVCIMLCVFVQMISHNKHSNQIKSKLFLDSFFWPILDLLSPMCHLVTLVANRHRCDVKFNFFKTSLFPSKKTSLNTKIWFKILEKISRDTLVNPFPSSCDIWWHCNVPPSQRFTPHISSGSIFRT
jgi:hypothetical protein